MHRTIRALAVAGLLVVGISAVPVSAAEPAPANDSISSPTVVGDLPFTDTIDTSGATSESGDPASCWYPDVGPDFATVWYSWTAAESGPIGAATWGSDYDTTIYVGTPDGNDGIAVLACNDDTRSLQAAVRFDAVAGETYLIAVGASVFGEGVGGQLVITLDVGPVPATANVEVDPAGAFAKGNVFFEGTVSCGSDAGLSHLLVVELVQRSGNRQTGAGTAFLDIEGCPGEDIPFEVEVPTDIGHFHPGRASAQVIWVACNDFECANETVDLQVTIGKQ
jgi:hypothetical protein